MGKDNGTFRPGRRRDRTATFSELGMDPAHIADRRPGAGLVLLMGCRPWEAEEHDRVNEGDTSRPIHERANEGRAPCPIHGWGKPRGKYAAMCLFCDRCTLDGKVEYPGLEAGSAMDPDYRGEGTVYVQGKLKGGKG